MSFPGQSLQRAWHLVDAKNQTVGRLAGQISQILRGKHKPTFRANKDMGDHVVVINAEKVGQSAIQNIAGYSYWNFFTLQRNPFTKSQKCCMSHSSQSLFLSKSSCSINFDP